MSIVLLVDAILVGFLLFFLMSAAASGTFFFIREDLRMRREAELHRQHAADAHERMLRRISETSYVMIEGHPEPVTSIEVGEHGTVETSMGFRIG